MTDTTFCRTKWTKVMYGMGVWSALKSYSVYDLSFGTTACVHVHRHRSILITILIRPLYLLPTTTFCVHTLVTRIQIINNNFNILNLYMSFPGGSNNSHEYSTQWIFWDFNCKTLKMVSVPTTIVWDMTTA